MRTERELAHVLGHERELELSSHFGSRDELNEERVQILASDSERELAHIFHELLMLCPNATDFFVSKKGHELSRTKHAI